MVVTGKCYCGQIKWTLVGKVDFTSNCHCKDCQTVSGSAYGTTSLMVYDPQGVKFDGLPKVIHGFADSGNTTQRGFCGNCGTVLFNHVSEGKEDEHWAIRTGCIVGDPPKTEKEIYMKSKPAWVPSPETTKKFDGMPH